MENLKENIKKIEEIKKESWKLKEKNDQLNKLQTQLYHSSYEEFCKNDKIIKQNKERMELNKLKIAILKNNLHYLLQLNFKGIENKIISYYEKGKIGEKTKEKIANEIKEYFLQKYDVKIGCYCVIDYGSNNSRYELKIVLYFLNSEDFRDYVLNYREELEILLGKYNFNNWEISVTYDKNIIEYVKIEELSTKARELKKEHKKAKKKIEELRNKQKELYHNFADYLHGFVYDELHIETKISIY